MTSTKTEAYVEVLVSNRRQELSSGKSCEGRKEWIPSRGGWYSCMMGPFLSRGLSFLSNNIRRSWPGKMGNIQLQLVGCKSKTYCSHFREVGCVQELIEQCFFESALL